MKKHDILNTYLQHEGNKEKTPTATTDIDSPTSNYKTIPMNMHKSHARPHHSDTEKVQDSGGDMEITVGCEDVVMSGLVDIIMTN